MIRRSLYDHFKQPLISLSLGWILICAIPGGVAGMENKDKLINDLYRKSGMEKQVEQFPELLKTAFVQASASQPNLKAMPKNVLDRMVQSIPSVFSGENIKKTMVEEIQASMDTGAIVKVIAWLDSPLGKKFTRMEEEASSVEAYEEQMAFIQNMKADQISPDRRTLYQKLDEAMNASEANVDMAMNMQLAITVAIVATLPVEKQPTQEQLQAMIEKSRSQMEILMKTQSMGSFIYTYRDSSDKELEQYLAFASTPEGKSYHETTIKGFKKAMVEGCFKWGGVIGDMIRERPVKTDV